MPTVLPPAIRRRLVRALLSAAGHFVEVLAADVLAAAGALPAHPTTDRLKASCAKCLPSRPAPGSTPSVRVWIKPAELSHLLGGLTDEEKAEAQTK